VCVQGKERRWGERESVEVNGLAVIIKLIIVWSNPQTLDPSPQT